METEMEKAKNIRQIKKSEGSRIGKMHVSYATQFRKQHLIYFSIVTSAGLFEMNSHD